MVPVLVVEPSHLNEESKKTGDAEGMVDTALGFRRLLCENFVEVRRDSHVVFAFSASTEKCIKLAAVVLYVFVFCNPELTKCNREDFQTGLGEGREHFVACKVIPARLTLVR